MKNFFYEIHTIVHIIHNMHTYCIPSYKYIYIHALNIFLLKVKECNYQWNDATVHNFCFKNLTDKLHIKYKKYLIISMQRITFKVIIIQLNKVINLHKHNKMTKYLMFQIFYVTFQALRWKRVIGHGRT